MNVRYAVLLGALLLSLCSASKRPRHPQSVTDHHAFPRARLRAIPAPSSFAGSALFGSSQEFSEGSPRFFRVPPKKRRLDWRGIANTWRIATSNTSPDPTPSRCIGHLKTYDRRCRKSASARHWQQSDGPDRLRLVAQQKHVPPHYPAVCVLLDDAASSAAERTVGFCFLLRQEPIREHGEGCRRRQALNTVQTYSPQNGKRVPGNVLDIFSPSF